MTAPTYDIEIVYGQFARMETPCARVVDKDGEVVASCRHQHRTPQAAFECGQRMMARYERRRRANA